MNIAAPYHHHPFRPGSRKAYKDQRTITPPQMDAGRAVSQARGHLVHCQFGQTIVSATPHTLIELRNHNITRIFVTPQTSAIVPPPGPQSPILGLPLTIPYPAGRLRGRKSGNGMAARLVGCVAARTARAICVRVCWTAPRHGILEADTSSLRQGLALRGIVASAWMDGSVCHRDIDDGGKRWRRGRILTGVCIVQMKGHLDSDASLWGSCERGWPRWNRCHGGWR